MIQTLNTSIGLDTDEMLVLDAFRVKRNAIDYSGYDVDEVSVESCIKAAEKLLEQLQIWLINNRNDLI